MKKDSKGFVTVGPIQNRIRVPIRAVELKAMEASGDPHLQKLVSRFTEAVRDNEEYYEKKAERERRLAEWNRERQARIDADPVLKAQQEARRQALADLFSAGDGD